MAHIGDFTHAGKFNNMGRGGINCTLLIWTARTLEQDFDTYLICVLLDEHIVAYVYVTCSIRYVFLN